MRSQKTRKTNEMRTGASKRGSRHVSGTDVSRIDTFKDALAAGTSLRTGLKQPSLHRQTVHAAIQQSQNQDYFGY